MHAAAPIVLRDALGLNLKLIVGYPDSNALFLAVDRNELEGQLAGWITSVFGEGKAEPARSKHHLRELLRADYRGLIVSMIHKFDRADADLHCQRWHGHRHCHCQRYQRCGCLPCRDL